MPIIGIETYLPTIDAFLIHWTQVNAALGTHPLFLKGDYGRAELADNRDELAALLQSVVLADNANQMASAARDDAKSLVRPRLTQFRGAVKSLLTGTPYDAALPVQPSAGSIASRYLKPFDEMAALWATINADTTTPDFTPPLKLAAGYTQAQFVTDLASLRARYGTLGQAEMTAKLARDQRDAPLLPIKARLIQYRNAVISAFPADSPLLRSLPSVTSSTGVTPDAVAASGAWDGPMGKGLLTWTPSDTPNVAYYAVRTAPGDTYRRKDETTVGHVPANTTSFATDAGLTMPGADALFKIYVVTATGNERGSATVEIARPV